VNTLLSARILIRLAVLAVLFFAVGHTIGEAGRKSNPAPAEREVLAAMQSHQLPVGGQLRSYDDLYTGLSINLSIALAAIAVLLWLLSGLAETQPRLCARLLWVPLLALAAYAVTGFRFFFSAPAFTSLVAAILLALALIRLRGTPTG
jgi:hypothetical protein